MSNTKIQIHGLPISMIIGLYPNERVEPQTITLDLELTLSRAVFDEDSTLDMTVDYAELVSQIKRFCESRDDGMLEVLGSALCDELLRDERIKSLRLVIHKPAAAAYLGIANIATVFERSRSSAT